MKDVGEGLMTVTPSRSAGNGASGSILEREILALLGRKGDPLTYEQVVGRVLASHLVTGEDARRVPTEKDAPQIAGTIAELLATLPRVTGSWAASVGPVYRTEQVRALLGGVSRQALADRARRRTMLALRTSDGHTVYPAWQFSGRTVLPGCPEVLQCFAPDGHGELVDPWTLASWLRTPLEPGEGRSVAELLAQGEVADAVSLSHSAARRWSR